MKDDLLQALTGHFRSLGLTEDEAVERAVRCLAGGAARFGSVQPEDLADLWRARARQGARTLLLEIEADTIDLATWTGQVNVLVLHEERWAHTRGAEPEGTRPARPAGAPVNLKH